MPERETSANIIHLPTRWLDAIRATAGPELNYHIVTVTLFDGRRFEGVVVDNGCITRVIGAKGVPFRAEDIRDVVAPYDKWVRLTGKWAREVVEMPETGMGYTVVSVQLHDGRQFDQVVINSGFITKVRGYERVPFQEDEISSMTVTNEKWNWSRE
jgi:hypothetical protein